MTTFALTLVLLSAVIHATWNLFAKRVAGGIAFQWLFTALSLPIYAPFALAVAIVTHLHVSAVVITFIAGTAILHITYFLLLMGGYRVGDLSLVYPLARGSGPLIATAAAIAIRGERPTILALAGAVLIAIGAFFLTGDPRALRRSGGGRAVAYALLTGLLIAVYTLWDKQAMTNVKMPPVFYYWGAICIQTVLLAPAALRHRHELEEAWRVYRMEALGVATFSPLAYFLVLTALAISPVSYVAPAREIGILIGAIMGSSLLAEGHMRRRLAAASLMVLGVVALAIG
jgi:drug/metabolite transporter (DMT)-like permease